MLVPKIIYYPGTPSDPVTLNFSFPPVQKPGAAHQRSATRHDTVSSDGSAVQSITERIELFRTLQMDTVPNEDLPAWEAFIDYALTGGQFDYYPDASDDLTYDIYTLADTDWNPAYAMRGYSKFKLKLRKWGAV